jgi:gas vesicle protein
MGQSAAELRREIEDTRDHLSGTFDAIGDRVSPRRMMERRTDRIRGRWYDMRDAVMGTASSTTSAIGDRTAALGGRASDVASGIGEHAGGMVGTVRETPMAVRRQAEGSPLAAGLVAFGFGLVVAAVLPKSQAEQQAAGKLASAAAPLKDELTNVAQEMVSELKGVGQQAAGQLQSTLSDSAAQVKDTASAVAGDVRDTGQQAAQEVTEQAKQATQQVKNP